MLQHTLLAEVADAAFQAHDRKANIQFDIYITKDTRKQRGV